jgi:hypothetical protein
MLIRWCDSEDYTEWTPDITNLAGDIRLSQGTKIIAAVPTRGETAVFTDTTVYSQTLTGDDNVFRFDAKGKAAGLMGPNAACDANGVVYAMGLTKFYTYDGQVLELPCEVHSRVFGTTDAPAINLVQAAKVFAAWNKRKTEVIFFFPAAGSNEVNKCVGVSTDAEHNWWLGSVASTAWLDEHPFQDTFTTPLGAVIGPDSLTYLYTQETGVDDAGVAIPYFLESYDMEIGASNNLITGTASGAGEFVYRFCKIIPDLFRIAGTHLVTLKGRKTPQDRQWTRGPKKLTSRDPAHRHAAPDPPDRYSDRIRRSGRRYLARDLAVRYRPRGRGLMARTTDVPLQYDPQTMRRVVSDLESRIDTVGKAVGTYTVQIYPGHQPRHGDGDGDRYRQFLVHPGPRPPKGEAVGRGIGDDMARHDENRDGAKRQIGLRRRAPSMRARSTSSWPSISRKCRPAIRRWMKPWPWPGACPSSSRAAWWWRWRKTGSSGLWELSKACCPGATCHISTRSGSMSYRSAGPAAPPPT